MTDAHRVAPVDAVALPSCQVGAAEAARKETVTIEGRLEATATVMRTMARRTMLHGSAHGWDMTVYGQSPMFWKI